MALNCSTAPCRSCPYRTDSKLGFWHRGHFVDLLFNDTQQFSPKYMCHKQNGQMCTGWVMNQVERDVPCLTLRVHFINTGVTRADTDALRCPVPLYPTLAAMALANFPDLADEIPPAAD